MLWRASLLAFVCIAFVCHPLAAQDYRIQTRERAAGGGGGFAIVQTCTGTDNGSVAAVVCDFASAVTSGNLIVCTAANEIRSDTQSVTWGGGPTWTTRAEENIIDHGDCAIGTATASGDFSPTAQFSATASFHDSIACYEFSSATIGTGTPTKDEDTDNPQHEVFTVAAAGSYVVAVMSDWGAVDGSDGLLTALPSTTVLSDVDGAGNTYTAYHYRSTNAAASATTYDIGFASGQHASAQVGHCMFEVAD